MKHLAALAVLLFSLSAAVGETVSNTASGKVASATATSASTDIGSRATVQVASMWVEHAEAATPTRLARPL